MTKDMQLFHNIVITSAGLEGSMPVFAGVYRALLREAWEIYWAVHPSSPTPGIDPFNLLAHIAYQDRGGRAR